MRHIRKKRDNNEAIVKIRKPQKLKAEVRFGLVVECVKCPVIGGTTIEHATRVTDNGNISIHHR